MLSENFWFKVKQKGDAERALHAERKRRFQETNDPAALEGQIMDEGLFMTSVENDERQTTAGCVCAVPWKAVGIKLAERTHQRSTAQEIAGELQRQEERRAAYAKSEDVLANRRTIVVRQAEPLPRRSA